MNLSKRSIVALALVLTACATAEDMQRARDSWNGASYEDVLKAWGAPERGTKTADGTQTSIEITNRTDNRWTADPMPPGTYTVKLTATDNLQVSNTVTQVVTVAAFTATALNLAAPTLVTLTLAALEPRRRLRRGPRAGRVRAR